MSRDAFFDLINPRADHSERDWFSTLLEDVDTNEVTLSAFGMLAWRVIQEDEAASVYLSPSAYSVYISTEGVPEEQFNHMLDRVRNKQWRRQKYHNFIGTNLDVAKPGNTNQRMAYYVHDGQVYVCELFPDHETYEKNLPGKYKENYHRPSFICL